MQCACCTRDSSWTGAEQSFAGEQAGAMPDEQMLRLRSAIGVQRRRRFFPSTVSGGIS